MELGPPGEKELGVAGMLTLPEQKQNKVDIDARRGTEVILSKKAAKKLKRKQEKKENKPPGTQYKPKRKHEKWMQKPYPDFTFTEKALQALHILCRKKFSEFDPTRKALFSTRACSFNTALFDFDEESNGAHGPPLQDPYGNQLKDLVGSTFNVISLRVVESAASFPISIYGTVIARDAVDYKAVYLFRRTRDDPQLINSKDDMLALTGPNRGIVARDTLFFEINLKIKDAPEFPGEDFSKGVKEQRVASAGRSPIIHKLTSWWSTVELVYTPLGRAAEATLEVKILNGPAPFIGKIIAWTSGNDNNDENHIILYESKEGPIGVEDCAEVARSVALSRNLVAVPIPRSYYDDYDTELSVCFIDLNGKREVAILEYPMEEEVCKLGCYELQVKVTWTAIVSPLYTNGVLNRWDCMPRNFFSSWTWMVDFDH